MRDPGLRSEHRAELQVGGLVLAAIVVLIAGVVWITGADVGGERFRFHVFSPQAAQVSEGSRVYLHGVDVGSVRSVRLAERGVVLGLEVSSDVSIPVDSRAEIAPSGFLGTQMVNLVPGGADRRLAAGDTIAGGTGADLQGLARELGQQAGDVLERTARVLSDTTIGSIESGADDMAAGLRELRQLVESERRTLESLVESLDRTSRNLEGATGPELERTVARLDSLTAELNRTGEGLTSSSRSLSSILEKVDRGEGSLGRLVNDRGLYESMTAAAENLQSASEQIALLSKDLRENPRKYLQGVKFSVF